MQKENYIAIAIYIVVKFMVEISPLHKAYTSATL